MKIRYTMELAALISAHSAQVLDCGQQLPDSGIRDYWSASQDRLTLWLAAFDSFESSDTAEHLRIADDEAAAVIEEILATESLTRIWGALLTALARRHGLSDAERVARGVYRGHLEARRRALSLMVNEASVCASAVARIDRLRRRIERWTDLLLGQMVETYDVADFAFDAERARDFGQEQLRRGVHLQNGLGWDLVLLSLRMAFPAESREQFPNDDCQQRIFKSILSCLPQEAFHNDGPFKSALQGRVGRSGLAAETSKIWQTFTKPKDALPLQPQPGSGPISFAKLQRRGKPPV